MKTIEQKAKKVPAIRFAGFEDEWVEKQLGDVAGVYDGVHQTPDYRNSGVMFLSVENISSLKSEKYISQDAFEKNYKVYPQKGDVLMTRIGDVGTPNVVESDEKIAYYVSLALLKPFDVDSYFLNDVIQSKTFQKRLKERTLLTAIPMKINKDEIGKVGIIHPIRKNEQRKIGSFFSNIDSLISLEQKKYDKLTQVKKSMLEKMFPKEGATVPEIRFSGFTGKWRKVKIETIASFTRGNGLSWKDIVNNGKYECILYGHLYTDYGMIADSIKYKTNTIPLNAVYSRFGDVLIPGSDTTPTGLARATSIEKDDVLLGGDINVIRPHENINGNFLSLAINVNRNELIKLIKGTTVRHIHNSDIKDIELCVPSVMKEQEMLGNYFKNLDSLISLQQRKLEKLKNIKKSLLEKMFV